MKDLIQTIRNIFSISELRDRIIYTLMLLLVFRLGSFIILPGIDSSILQSSFNSARNAGGGVLDFFNIFLGGAFARGSIFALGIMPYISASIVVQLLGAVVPSIQKLRAEGDSGTKKLNQITRYLSIIIGLAQSASYVGYLKGQYPQAITDSSFFIFTTVFLMTAGIMFLVWLGERITDNGIGNGTSLIIAIGIVSGFLPALISEAKANKPMVFFIEVLLLAIVTMAVIALTQATRRIPINYARQMMGNRQMTAKEKGMTEAPRQYIPLKMNSSGVMPIIFAQTLVMVPTYLLGLFNNSYLSAVGGAFNEITGIWYNLLFVLLIVIFTYFYTAIAVNPTEIADQLKRTGGFVPGIKPGKNTADYIDSILSKITLPGSLSLAAIAILPAVAMICGVSGNFAKFFGGTTILIMIGVVLDTLQQIESYLLNRHYDGLMKTGRIKGRERSGAIAS